MFGDSGIQSQFNAFGQSILILDKRGKQSFRTWVQCDRHAGMGADTISEHMGTNNEHKKNRRSGEH